MSISKFTYLKDPLMLCDSEIHRSEVKIPSLMNITSSVGPVLLNEMKKFEKLPKGSTEPDH